MSDCTENQPTYPESGTTLPSIEDIEGACAESSLCPQSECVQASATQAAPVCPDENSLRSTASCGYTLPNGFTDPVEDLNGEGITILGRIGNKLAKFSGNGFIQLVCGKAKVVSSVAMKVTSLWHQWWKPDRINGNPVLGDPYPIPYMLVADSDGNMHLVKGFADKQAVLVWDNEAGAWTVCDSADFQLFSNGTEEQVSALEIAGFAPLAAGSSCDTARPMAVLAGEGVLYAESALSCVDESSECGTQRTASVSKFLPFPTGTGEYVLKYNSADGLRWVAETS